MALLSVIRRWHIREGMPIREIARRTGLSRNTVRKYLANQVIEPVYPARKTPSNLDDYEETLTNWLFRETRRHRKQRKTVKQLYRDLMTLGYSGSYDRVAAFARSWRQSQAEARLAAGKQVYVPLHFAPGEAFQFDWGERWIKINGVSTKLQIAHFKLCCSRAFFLRAYLTQSHEMLFDAHFHAFQAFGGVPQRGIYDKRPGGDREMADILALVLLHDEQRVEQAIRKALEPGELSKAHVLNCLSRLEQPPALRLVTKPQADTARYDQLRRVRDER